MTIGKAIRQFEELVSLPELLMVL